MMPVIFLVVVGLALFSAFLVIALGGQKAAHPNVAAVSAVGEMIRLGGVSFSNSKRLLDDSEYKSLLANPKLRGVAKHLRAERSQIMSLWISALLADLTALWRFRRFLVRHGAPVRPGEEFKVLRTFVLCWALLIGLKLAIRLAGPFATTQLVRQAGDFVGGMSDVCASTLGRVPSAVWPEIERRWMAQAA